MDLKGWNLVGQRKLALAVELDWERCENGIKMGQIEISCGRFSIIKQHSSMKIKGIVITAVGTARIWEISWILKKPEYI
jgi:hypothetical protein